MTEELVLSYLIYARPNLAVLYNWLTKVSKTKPAVD